MDTSDFDEYIGNAIRKEQCERLCVQLASLLPYMKHEERQYIDRVARSPSPSERELETLDHLLFFYKCQ